MPQLHGHAGANLKLKVRAGVGVFVHWSQPAWRYVSRRRWTLPAKTIMRSVSVIFRVEYRNANSAR